MRDDICTIPVSEVFEPKEGCPICRMRDMLEERVLEYVLGAAMMEPDVRIKTNELGFCTQHLSMMMNRPGRLPLALMLKTHLDYISKEALGGEKGKASKKSSYKAARILETCFVCDRIEWGMERLLNTVYRVYSSEPDFKALFREQERLCLPHYRLLTENMGSLDKKKQKEFLEDCTRLSGEYLKSLRDDVGHFCEMFDYRNNGADWNGAKDSIERTAAFLSGREVK